MRPIDTARKSFATIESWRLDHVVETWGVFDGKHRDNNNELTISTDNQRIVRRIIDPLKA